MIGGVIYIRVGGIVDISTKDIPGRASMVIFTVGCNFRCKFCHNKYLLYASVGKETDIENLLKKIKSNQLVKSISITGGEPTLQDDLPLLCDKILKLDKLLSIDTNGSKPEVIEKILSNVNRIALDLKANPLDNQRYDEITGVKMDTSKIIKTFELINQNKNINFEIRTTFVENLSKKEDIEGIITFLRKKNFEGTYVIQQYQYSEGVGEEFKDIFEKPLHSTLLALLEPYNNSNLGFGLYLRSNIVGYKSIEELFN